MKNIKNKKSARIIFVGFALILATVLIATAITSYERQPRPIELGVSGGNINDYKKPYCYGGTLGSLVQDASGNQYILSNNHVLARENNALIGEGIIQPGLIDQSPTCYKNNSDVVANLYNFKSISFKSTNTIDAAIAKVLSGKVAQNGSILGIGTVNSSIISTPTIGMGVKKSGRTTGLTYGSISSVNVNVKIKYSKGIATFVNQILITPGGFSAAGDSGSLIVESAALNPRPVGLLFAGSSSSTIANPIGDVLSYFNVFMANDLTSSSILSTTSPLLEGNAMTTQSKLPNQANNNAIGAATKVRDRHENALLNNEGVVGTGIGFSETMPDKVVIQVYVKKSANEMKRVIPQELEGISVEIVETGEFVAR